MSCAWAATAEFACMRPLGRRAVTGMCRWSRICCSAKSASGASAAELRTCPRTLSAGGVRRGGTHEWSAWVAPEEAALARA
eukprot:scaffold1723_cov104-Isochrysis_galbana.AAC.6